MPQSAINGNTQNKEQNRQKLIQTAIDVIVENGIQGTSMNMVAKRCDLTMRTAINHFGTRDSLIAAATEQYLHTTLNSMKPKLCDASFASLTGLSQIRFYLDYRSSFLFADARPFLLIDEMESYFGNDKTYAIVLNAHIEYLNFINDCILSALNKGISDGTVRRDIDLEKAENLLTSTFHALLQRLAVVISSPGLSARFDARRKLQVFIETGIYYLTQYPLVNRLVSGKKMLIVDDIASNRVVLQTLFQDDFSILLAENGQQAFERLEANPDIALIILDLNMPVMDGFSFLQRIRQNRCFDNTAVVIDTAYGDDVSEIRALALGADEFIYKPFNPDIIRYRVHNTMLKFQTIAENDRLQARLHNLEKIPSIPIDWQQEREQ